MFIWIANFARIQKENKRFLASTALARASGPREYSFHYLLCETRNA